MGVILPSTRVFVDDSGSRSFRRSQDGQAPTGNVSCAAIIPLPTESKVIAALPRCPNTREILKAQDARLTPEAARIAVESLLQIDQLELALLVVDVSSQQSFQSFIKGIFASDSVRKAKHERLISGPNLFYSLFTGHVVAAAWGNAYVRHGNRLSYLDLILDEANLHRREQKLFTKVVKNVSERNGIMFRNILWSNEQAYPLLHVPDLISGIYNRGVAHDDVQQAIQLLEKAKDAGRISVDQGLKVQIPSEEEVLEIVRSIK